MRAGVNVRSYRPVQVSFRSAKPAAPRLGMSLSSIQRKWLSLMVASALVIGVAGTQFLHGRMVEMRTNAEKVRTVNNHISTENIRLLSMRAQLTSKDHVAALAGKKLNLFEPGQGQVHRM